MSNSPTFFVTGATGFIGLVLCRTLRKRYPSAKIFAQTREPGNVSKLTMAGVEPVVVSIRELKSVSDKLLDSDYVFHLAANAQFGAKGDLNGDNVTPIEHLCDILRSSSKLKRLVFTSTVGAVDRAASDNCSQPLVDDSPPHPTSNYGRSKLAGEETLMLSAIPWTIIRPTWVYGPGMRSGSHLAFFLSEALRGGIISRISFPGRVAVVHVEDLVEAMLLSATREDCLNRRFLVSEEAPVTIGEVLKLGLGAGRRNKLQVPIPREINSLLFPIWRYLPFAYKVMFSDAYTVRSQFSDISGWQPHHNFRTSSRELIDSLYGKDGTLVLTGAASGIGKALAVKLRQEGYPLLLVDRDPSIERTARDLGAKFQIEDLSNELASDRIIERIKEDKIPVSGVIHCAGAGWRGEFASQDESSIKSLIQLNLTFPITFTRALLPLLKGRTASFVSFVASSISAVPLPFMAIYGSTKSGLLSFALALRGEISSSGVNVSVILPSGTRTRFQESAGVKVLKEGQGLLDPAVVAERAVKAIQDRRATEAVGIMGRILSQVTSILPYNLQVVLWRRMMGSWR